MSIGAVVPRFCVLRGSMWVQWLKRQEFCGRDKWKRTQVSTEQGKDSGNVGWVHKGRLKVRAQETGIQAQ